MADIVVDNPELLEATLDEVTKLKELFSNLAKKEAERSKRDKYGRALRQLEESDLPILTLGPEFDANKSIASITQQFKKNAENLNWEPSVVEYNDVKYLVNFDAEDAEAKFNTYILNKAGISEQQLAAITRDLDASTR